MKEKVNWKKEYKFDNVFNIIMSILELGIIIYEFFFNSGESIIGVILTPIFAQLYINLSASRFFVDDHKYE